jgi:peptide/nickel transport system permease protein/nickel transport system permease protein
MFMQSHLQKLFQHKPAILSIIIIVFLFFTGILAPLIAPHDPNLVNLEQKLEAPSREFPMGTDHLGRCLLSRLIYATGISLNTAFIVMALTISVSLVIGTYSGYVGGKVDNLLMRLCDVLLAFPNLILALAIVGMLGPSLVNVMLAMIAVHWVWYARMIRGMVLSLKESNFVLAAKVCGTGGPQIIMRHILPNIISQIIVLASLDMGWIILSISGLSFLGLGIQPPTPEWGAMLNDGRQFLRSNPSLMVYPGMVILIVVLAFNLLGDALRDVLDPKDFKQGGIL